MKSSGMSLRIFWGVLFAILTGIAFGIIYMRISEGTIGVGGLLSAFLFAFGIALLFALLFARGFKRLLRRLTVVVDGVSQGFFHRRLHLAPENELYTLASAFNQMSEKVGQRIDQLSDQKAQLKSILETMNDGVLVLGAKGRIRSYNRAFIDMFPLASCREGAAVIELIPSVALQDAVDRLLRGEGDTANVLEIPVADRLISVHLARSDRACAGFGAVVVFRDVSRLMRLERIRRDFVANVSHELRTPLTVIQGYAETLMRMQDVREEYSTFAATIYRNGNYLSRMVEELLALARIENEQTDFPLSPVLLCEPLENALVFCQEQIAGKGIKIEVDIASDLEVLGNAHGLMQVFRNLIENACRYSSQNSKIAVSVLMDAGMVQVSVSDWGSGIAQDALGRVFERFYRVDGQRAAGSTGLGLAICKHIVERHGGRIWVESPTAKAQTVFYFTVRAV